MRSMRPSYQSFSSSFQQGVRAPAVDADTAPTVAAIRPASSSAWRRCLRGAITKVETGCAEAGWRGVFRTGVCGRFGPCKTFVRPFPSRLRAMLLSPRMRARRQLLSPLAPALALIAAALFFGGGPGDGSLPWLGGAAIVVVAVLAATHGARGLVALAPLAALAIWCAASVA